MNWAGALGTPVEQKEVGTPKVYDLPAFDYYKDPKKMDVISKIAETSARDPRIATFAVKILREAGVKPREYKKQAAALLAWVQNPKNFYYVNEPDERLQEPLYSLKVRYGDCDDVAILVYALARSIRLPARLVISGVDKRGKKVRYIQGDKHYPSGVDWAHIYLQIGDRPYGDPVWYFAEPTLQVPLGWDVVDNDASALPELRGSFGAPETPAAPDYKKLALAALAGAAAMHLYHKWARERA
jgi:transglutaminase-like putative cysteine protease